MTVRLCDCPSACLSVCRSIRLFLKRNADEIVVILSTSKIETKVKEEEAGQYEEVQEVAFREEIEEAAPSKEEEEEGEEEEEEEEEIKAEGQSEASFFADLFGDVSFCRRIMALIYYRIAYVLTDDIRARTGGIFACTGAVYACTGAVYARERAV